jgi:hypothetical protein
MKNSIFTIPALACALSLAGVSSLTAGLTGAIFTTDITGTVVNGNQYPSPCSVYLNGGPGPHAPAHAAGLPDGDYYFQVTDPSGKTLLSTDMVQNRSFHVTGGVIVAYTGIGGPAHAINPDQNDPGGFTIALANSSCPADFKPTPNNGDAYKVWVTPVSSFIGDPTVVDTPCGNGCFHGFIPSASKTDNFKVNTAAATFCLTVQKVDGSTPPAPVGSWQFNLTDPLGTVNAYFTNTTSTGTFMLCGLVAGTYTLSEITGFLGSTIIGITVNNLPVTPAITSAATSTSFTWVAGQPAPTIVFQNCLAGETCPPPPGGVPQ